MAISPGCLDVRKGAELWSMVQRQGVGNWLGQCKVGDTGSVIHK